MLLQKEHIIKVACNPLFRISYIKVLIIVIFMVFAVFFVTLILSH